MESHLVVLKSLEWREGNRIPLPANSYRSRTIICCSYEGRRKAEFANGIFPYFSYIEILGSRGTWSPRGVNIVPVLPDGKVLMVIEQRPAQYVSDQHPQYVYVDGKTIPLASFGPYSSLEFPGGGIDPEDKNMTIGALRELWEETGVDDQEIEIYTQTHPTHLMGSDIALEGYLTIVRLSDGRFAAKVKNDGGLKVFSLSEDEVEYNRHLGVFSAAQAGLLTWAFYKEVIRAHPMDLKRLQDIGYLTITKTVLKRPK
ncbi:MAG: NUDIX domain-containing protein [bacterium]|nr:NUDIX domain-containing protein [bacterium]